MEELDQTHHHLNLASNLVVVDSVRPNGDMVTLSSSKHREDQTSPGSQDNLVMQMYGE